MEICFSSRKLERMCLDYGKSLAQYGRRMAELIVQRINEISAAESVEVMVMHRIGRCHELKGNRKQQYAVDLVHPYRLVFSITGAHPWVACIIGIIDYH